MRFSLSTLAQPYIFAAFMYAGIVIGVLYSIFSLIRKAFRGGKAATVVCDMLFCVTAGFAVLFVLYTAVSFRLRLYYVFGLAAGAGLYFAAVYPLAKSIRAKLTKKNVDNGSKNAFNNK